MNRLIQAVWRKLCALGLLLSWPCWPGFSPAKAGPFEPGLPLATNIFALRIMNTADSGRVCAYDLEGTILAANCNSGTLFFQDNSGTAVLEMNLQGREIRAGQKIRLRGTNYVAYAGFDLTLGIRPVVDVDGAHSAIERTGAVFLMAGRHPIQVNWFNWYATAYLKAAYSGPHLVKQTIPDQVLWQTPTASDNATGRGSQGLRYRCFEGDWTSLPDFDRLTPVKMGVVSNFDVDVRTRPEFVGLEFKGFLDVPESGDYKFYLGSDDGGQLFLDSQPPSLSIEGTASVPPPQPITLGQPLPSNPESLWAETEGTVIFLSKNRNGAVLELASGENRMRVELPGTSPELPWHLLHSRVRVRGIYSDIRGLDGQTHPGYITAADWRNIRVLEVAPEYWSAFKAGTVAGLSPAAPASSGEIIHLLGHLISDATSHATRFDDGTGSAPMELLTQSPPEPGSAIECLCRWSRDGTNILLHEAVVRELPGGVEGKPRPLPVLTTAIQVQQLKREEAQWAYPVEIQGVVINVSHDFTSLVIQDSTRAVYVGQCDQSEKTLPHVGDYCKIKGVTDPGDFSPVVQFRDVTVLGKGQMPQPLSPTRDQLLSGSLDAQYVELRGMVTATNDDSVTLLTPEGTLDLIIDPAPGESWGRFLNAIIRVRGCFFPRWDKETHRVILNGPIAGIRDATVSVDVPAPTDLFQADQVPGKELMQFDVRSDTFRRVKISGQIVHCSSDMDYMMDGTTGLRFQLAQPLPLESGDEAEVVGLVELGGASPVLRQAVAQKTGHSPLPEPRQITLDSLSDSDDSTLVGIEGTLVDLQNRDSEQVLEMQVGVKNFVARLASDPGVAASWTIGSRLRLTGVFHALDGNQMAGHNISSFELLLNSPADVQVIARPPWWTLGRLLVVVAALLLGLALAFIWIRSLRQQVERRTRQLEREISERERAEKLRAIEHERSRIARDLHDDLGSTLTEISMMATASPGLKIESEMAVNRLREIAEKSRSMVSALDGVVWVVNSKNDTLSSLIEYLASHAEEFLSKAQVACRIELPKSCSERTIAAEIRHDVMLAVREVLNNAVRHGRPNEVLFRMIIAGDNLEILVQDNGCGFDPVQAKGNGLGNLQQRMAKLNGSCQIQCAPGNGTAVVLKLPLPK